MKIALAQMEMSEKMEDNLKKTVEFIRLASQSGADLICFPEIHLSRFFPQYENIDASEYLMTYESEYLLEIQDACRKYGIHASPNIYLNENGQKYDASLLIDDRGEIIGCQKMVHVAQEEKFYEQTYYAPSNDGFKIFDTEFGKIAIIVCYDRHYPESIRTQALNGADLILIPTANTSDEPMEMFKWEVKVQAFQNSVPIAMCNRVGMEDEMEFSGQSIVVDDNGNTVALAGNAEKLLFADVDLNVSEKRYVNLRRKELYR